MSHIIKPTFHDERKVAAYKEHARQQEKQMQDAAVTLMQLLNFKFESVDEVRSMTLDYLKTKIEESRNRMIGTLKVSSFVPEKVAQFYDNSFAEVLKEAEPQINTLRNAIQFFDNEKIGLKIDSKGRPWANEKDVEKIANEKTIFTFSDEQRKYYSVICDALDALNEITKYEKQQKINRFSIGETPANAFGNYKWDFIGQMQMKDENGLRFQLTAQKYYELVTQGVLCSHYTPKDDYNKDLNDNL
jgi:hypothetical protein